jgi:hypothetical protein
MIKDIYIRDENDPFYNPTIIDYANDNEYVISQIKMILSTNPGQVLGDYDFGVDLEYMVFGTKKNAEEIKEKIKQQIQTYVKLPLGMSVDCALNFGKDNNGSEYAVIDIYINGAKSIGFLIDKNL